MGLTYIIGGNFRGGTSITAKLVEACGIDLPGPYHTSFNMENRPIQNLLHPHHKSGQLPKKEQKKLHDLATQYSETHGTWGFKYPASHQFICSRFFSLFTNPQIVLITRSPEAVLASERRALGSVDTKAIRRRAAAYNDDMRCIRQSLRYSCLLLRYEDLISDPEQECLKICNFVGRGVDTAHEIAKLVKR